MDFGDRISVLVKGSYVPDFGDSAMNMEGERGGEGGLAVAL